MVVLSSSFFLLSSSLLCHQSKQPGKKKKKRSDANIQARVKIDMEVQIRQAQEADALKVNGIAKWAEGWNRKNNLKGKYFVSCFQIILLFFFLPHNYFNLSCWYS